MSKHNIFLVFDTPALLSANPKNPEQVWLNNTVLGKCIVPGGTVEELINLKGKKNSQAKMALKFINFNRRCNQYEIWGKEDNKVIPIPNRFNSRDRQILASVFNLAREEKNALIILITHESIMDFLINNSTVKQKIPNLCTIPGKELAKWFHEYRFKNLLPKAVREAEQRLINFRSYKIENPVISSKRRQKRISNVSHSNSVKKIINNKLESRNSNRRKLHSSSNNNYKLPGNSEIKSQNKKIINRAGINTSNIWIKSLAFLIIVFFALLLAILFKSNNEMNNGETQSNLITESDACILEAQRTQQDFSCFKKSIEAFEKLKRRQDGKLNWEAEQSLSTLKHKYAIQVLASQNQIERALSMLDEIPSSYSQIDEVNEKIRKYERTLNAR